MLTSPGLEQRAFGCMIGAALGDAFGMPLEFGPSLHGTSRFVRDLIAGRLPAGCFTDDTEMALALTESLLAQRPLDPDDLAQRFVAWYRTDPPDVGTHTRAVLSQIAVGESWQTAAQAAFARNPNGAANGSVMRCFPVSVAYWDDLTTCIAESAIQSDVTHPHPECRAACMFVNAALWHLLHGHAPSEAIQLALDDVPAMPTDLRTAVEQAPGKSAVELPNTGWVRHTVESAVWGLLTTRSFEEAIIQVGNLGNDADTAAAVTGALAGAAYGLEAIPMQWRVQLRGQWLPKSGTILRENAIVELTSRLLETAS